MNLKYFYFILYFFGNETVTQCDENRVFNVILEINFCP